MMPGDLVTMMYPEDGRLVLWHAPYDTALQMHVATFIHDRDIALVITLHEGEALLLVRAAYGWQRQVLFRIP